MYFTLANLLKLTKFDDIIARGGGLTKSQSKETG